MTIPGGPVGAPMPRWLGRVRALLLAVLLVTLGLTTFGDPPDWVTTVMAVCALCLGATRLWDQLRRTSGPPPRLVRLWRRTDGQHRRDHSGDWW